jgi:TP901 family phage tail tape measure protein
MSETLTTELEIEDKSTHAVDKIAKSFENLSKKVFKTSKKLIDQRKEFNKHKATYKFNKKVLSELQDIHKGMSKRVSASNRTLKLLRKRLQDTSKATDQAQSSMQKYDFSLRKLKRPHILTVKNLRRVAIVSWEATKGAIALQKAMLKFVRSGITRTLGVLGQRLVGISEGFGRIGRGGMAALGQAMKDLLRGGVQALANGLKSLAKQGVAEFGKLQTSFQKISNFMGGMTEGEMQQFKTTFSEIAKGSVFSLDELSKAFESLASVGDLSGQELEDVGKVMEKLATASGSDLAATGELLIKTMNAFGQEGAEAANHFGEVLLKVANDSALDMKSLGDSMQLVSGNAAAIGMTVEETAAALGFLSNQGMTASRAGTSLNQAMTKMIKPTAQAQAAMASLGVDFFDANGDMEDMTKIIGDLSNATADMDNEMKLLKIQEIFGVRGSRAILAMMNNTEQLNEAIDTTSGELNNLEKQSASMSSTVEGSMQKMNNSLDLVKAGFGEALAPAVMLALDSFTDFINNNEEFNKLMEDMGVILNQVLMDLIPIVMDMLPTFVALLDSLLPVLSVLGKLLGEVFKMFAKGTPLFNTLMKIVDLLVQAFTAIAPVILMLVDVFMSNLMPVLAELLDIFVTMILPVLLEFFVMFLEMIPEIMPLIMVLIDIIKMLMPPIMQLVKILMKSLFKIIMMLIPVFMQFAKILQDNIGLFLMIIQIITLLAPLLNLLVPAVMLLAWVFQKVLLPILDMVLKGISTFIEFVLKGIRTLLNGIINIAKKVPGAGGLVDKLRDARDGVDSAIAASQTTSIQSDFDTPEAPDFGSFTTEAPANEGTGSTTTNTTNTSTTESNIYVNSTGDTDQDAEEVADKYAHALAGRLVE